MYGYGHARGSAADTYLACTSMWFACLLHNTFFWRWRAKIKWFRHSHLAKSAARAQKMSQIADRKPLLMQSPTFRRQAAHPSFSYLIRFPLCVCPSPLSYRIISFSIACNIPTTISSTSLSISASYPHRRHARHLPITTQERS